MCSMPTSSRTMTLENDGPGRWHIFLGAVLGLCGLLTIAAALTFIDPHVRDADGLVFSLPSWIDSTSNGEPGIRRQSEKPIFGPAVR